MFGGIPRQGMGMGMGMGFSGGMYQQAGPGFGMMNGAGMSMSVSETAQGKQRVQEPEAQFDDAAFEEAFKQAEVQDRVYRTAKIWQEETEKHWRKHFAPIVALAQAVKDSDFVAVEKSLKEWTAAQAEGELDPAQLQLGLSQLQMLSDMGTQVPQHVRELNNRLIESINARLMSENPLFAPVPTSEALEPQNQEHVPRQDAEQEQEQQQQQQKQNDDDAMAATAGQLLTSVADNTSEKFKNSQFLELMRRLRDREVRVEEDKIVDVDVGTTSVPVQSSTSAATASSAVDTANTSGVVGSGSSTAGALDNFQRQLDLIEQQNRKRMEAGGVGMGTSVPPIDREILNHAATDFELPVDSTDEMTDAMFK